MHTLELLAEEHRIHRRLLDGLEQLLRRRDRAAPVPSTLLRRLCRFLETAVDGLHQEKEERALFPQLVGRLGRLEFPELLRLEAQHRRDRRLLARLRLASFDESLEEDPWTTARTYVAFQRRHLAEEERQLFPLAARVLSPADDRIVRAGFRRIERERGISFLPGAHELLAELTLAQVDAGAPSRLRVVS